MDKVIDINHLEKRYGNKIAIYHYSLSAEKGDIISLLGPNGSGKSTLIKMITGLLPACAGQGTCMGYDLMTEQIKIRSRIGYMPQKFSLYRKLTVYENLLLFAQIRKIIKPKQRVLQVIEEFNLNKYRDHYTYELSGGWQQRLSLAAAILHQPTLVILDEPTAGVDPESRQLIWKQIQTLSKQGMTFIVATHYLDEAIKSHFIQFLFHGKLITSGKAQDIICDSGLMTWTISGEQVRAVMMSLEQVAPQLQILEYGDHLRISSKEADWLDLINCLNLNCCVNKVTPILEDCFVHYSTQLRDER